MIGARWLDGQKLASYLNGRRIAGVRFVPIRFTPTSSVFKNEDRSGVNIVITDRSRFRSVQAGLEIAVALHQLFPTDWKIEGYAHLLVNADTLERLKRGESAEEITRSWLDALERVRRARVRALLYD